MDTADLKKIATRRRSMREDGFAILLGSVLLALFLFIPAKGGQQPIEPASEPSVVAEAVVPNAFEKIELQAKAAIVYDLVTGETLYEKNADAQLPLASLTKLLTVYAATRVFSPNTTITIPASAVAVTPPKVFFEGQSFTFADIARLTLTASLNDGAVAIATAATKHEGSTQNEMLAGAAASLKLSQTFAVNGSGLDMNAAVSGGYGSARDLARLAGALVEKAPSITKATTQEFAQATSAGGTSFKVKNTDPIIDSIPRLLLSKTGYTDLAGGNLALVFDSGIKHPIAIVVLGSSKTNRFTDGTALVDATLAHFAGVDSL